MAASATNGGTAAILVSALLMRDERVLLCASGGAWALPSVVLEDAEELEDALARLLDAGLGLADWREEFLDTFYEPAATGRLVRNVYAVDAARAASEVETALALHWASEEELDDLGVAESLRAVLRQAGAFAAGPSLTGAAPIYIVTGPPAAGKSTVAELLCRDFERAAHIELDAIQHMVRSGYASPLPGRADPVAAAVQIELALANAGALAANFASRGFHAVIDGVLETPEQLDHLLAQFEAPAEVYFVTLLPDDDALQQRDAAREAGARIGARALEVRRVLEENGEWRGLRLDTSTETPGETVAQILGRRALARLA